MGRDPKPQIGAPDQSRTWLLQALATPATYGIREPVLIRETHASWVFLAGEYAYKVKKPVRLGFLDYETLERRHAACLQELQVNRELAGGIYLDVLAILRDGEGIRFAPHGDPGAVEYALRMRRFDEAETLKSRISQGTLNRGAIAAIAQRLAEFHDTASISRGGGTCATLGSWEENLRELESIVGDDRLVRAMRRFGRAFVNAHTPELENRVRIGRIRDGHGDLRCEHMLLNDPVRIVDRIEFDPSLREIDVGRDLAFLVMDLHAEGQEPAASWLLAEYRHAGGDPGSEQLVSFYAAYWALVRTKVALIAEDEHIAGSGGRAGRFLALAHRLCWQARAPRVIVLAGPAASGKSTLAAQLSQVAGWPVLSSDETRKRLAGLASTARAAPEQYTEEFTRRTYRALGTQAAGLLACRIGVLIDASCSKRFERAELLEHIDGTPAPLFIECRVTLETALARAAARLGDPGRVSDATPEIVAAQFREFEALDEQAGAVSVDCEAPLEHQLEVATAAVDRALARRDDRLLATT